MMEIEAKIRAFFPVITLALTIIACGEYPGAPRVVEGGVSEVIDLREIRDNGGNPTDSGTGGNVVIESDVNIELKDFEIMPSDQTITTGEVSFTLVNIGRFTHDFRIEGEGADEKSPRITAGRTDECTINQSILDPSANIVDGYDPIMPPNLIKVVGEENLDDLIAFILSLE